MQPVQDLLHRIRWDQVFAEADFEIGYYDRVADWIVRVPFATLHFPEDDSFGFELYDGSSVPPRPDAGLFWLLFWAEPEK